MHTTTVEIPGGPERDDELRRLLALAQIYRCETAVWSGPLSDPGSLVFHAWTDDPKRMAAERRNPYSDDPLGRDFLSYTYLFADDVDQLAQTIELPPTLT